MKQRAPPDPLRYRSKATPGSYTERDDEEKKFALRSAALVVADSTRDSMTHAQIFDDASERPPCGCFNKFALCNYEDLPLWMRDNKNVGQGYRRYFSHWLAAKSVFRWHNETLNIWTHLVGTLLSVYLMFVLHTDSQRFFGYIVSNPVVQTPDLVIFSVFLSGLFFQMFFSTVFHTFCCVDTRTYLITAKLDYAGIAMMIVGSYYAPLYYGFHCHPHLGYIYLSAVTLLGLTCVFASLNPIFSTPRFRQTRLVLFVCFGFFGVIPIPHQGFLVGWELLKPVLLREVGMGSLYLAGCFFYLTRLPESRWPRKWDYFNSHVFWHLFVLFAGVAQLYVSLWCYQHRKDQCPVS